MTAISTRRPLFLNRPQRFRLAVRRVLIAACFIIPPVAFVAGFFFGG